MALSFDPLALPVDSIDDHLPAVSLEQLHAEALRRGASEEEIRRLMDMYEQAIENYLAAQMAEALRNGRVTQGNGQQQPDHAVRRTQTDHRRGRCQTDEQQLPAGGSGQRGRVVDRVVEDLHLEPIARVVEPAARGDGVGCREVVGLEAVPLMLLALSTAVLFYLYRIPRQLG